MLARVRAHFAATGALEVETPVAVAAAVTDPGIASLAVVERDLWLQTSPESAMKRLLATGSGDIYQVARCFRAGDCGAVHSEEFSMLEWYRCGSDRERLAAEALELLQMLLGPRPVQHQSYAGLMADCGVNPHTDADATIGVLASEVADSDWREIDRTACLDLIFSHLVAPALPTGHLTLVYDYPECMSALARLRSCGDGPPVALRFEIFAGAVELVNGYEELTDADEQAHRFAADRELRCARGLPDVVPDAALLAALAQGLPACSGASMGLDRVLMLQLQAETITEVRVADSPDG